MEQSHVDTHLFSSCSPASPLERQQKQVNKGTCQSHARYVDGKEQAERIILGGSREDREREGAQNTWIPRSWESSARSQWCAWSRPASRRSGILPRVFWKPRALPTPCSLCFPRKQSQQTTMGLEASHLIPTGLSCSSEEGFYLK